jgi:ACR3 family arsenite efflux pump ArsB
MERNETMVLQEQPIEVQPEPVKDEQKQKKLSFLDRYLSLWILLAMVGGTLLGVYAPSVRQVLNTSHADNVSLPVFIGLLLMLYPVFCKVRYEKLKLILTDKQNVGYISFSFIMNWVFFDYGRLFARCS